MPNIATTLQPLYKALKGNPKTLEWNESLEVAFNAAKMSLANAARLVFPDPSAPLALTTDASDVAAAAVLEQFNPKTSAWEPLAFFSRHL